MGRPAQRQSPVGIHLQRELPESAAVLIPVLRIPVLSVTAMLSFRDQLPILVVLKQWSDGVHDFSPHRVARSPVQHGPLAFAAPVCDLVSQRGPFQLA
jgi:hypothetical protein